MIRGMTLLADISTIDPSSPITQNGLATVALIVTAVIAHVALRRLVHDRAHGEERRRWIVAARNAVLVASIFGLVVIWGAQLRALALSLVAFAAAMTIASKELILSILGSFYRAVTGGWSVGDRIEVGAFRGDVIDHSLLSTKLLEVGPGANSHQFTGRSVTVPNALFLTSPVVNESHTSNFVLHVVRVAVKPAAVADAERRLLAAAEAEVAPYIDEAARHLQTLYSSRGLVAPGVEPRIMLTVDGPERIDMVLRFAAPARHKGRVEQAILRRYLITSVDDVGDEADDA